MASVAFVDTTVSPAVVAKDIWPEGPTRCSRCQRPECRRRGRAGDRGLPGSYAVAYADNGGDGDGLGIALRIANPSAGTVGPLIRVNTTTALGQHEPDVIWTGTELVVVWTDQSSFLTSKTDLRVRRFTAAGAAIDAESKLALSTLQETAPVLSTFGGSWAAVWRTSDAASETLNVRSALPSVQWQLLNIDPAPDAEKATLVELDAQHLLAVFVAGGLLADPPRLRGAILDTSVPGVTPSFAIDALVAPYSSNTALGQTQPVLVRAGSRVYLAWRSERVLGAPEGEELWLKELVWIAAEAGFTLDLSKSEIPIPRWSQH